ncbi:FAD-binding oxidoreductase [Amycolatopsis aidingensis]|uniref:FAD-binding oxidoreductase n=1 Tax=Amycolatopsis aidingensis TaxID=2842453 RepID=UPI001E56909B|nr:FAD-binding oxidoreductase [Amycolatopsis aidingensis]
MFDRKPALIARCRTTGDVREALRYAAIVNLPVTVRGGGHNVAGAAVADGALLIDLSLMRDVRVDPVGRVARAQGGCLLSDLDAATTAHDLACPAGVVSHTGLGGLVLGGGYGWLARQWGLTCDHLIAAEVVLADGSVVEASESEHEDLMWALRGGGGNFGVVTRFTLRLRPVGTIHHHTAVYPAGDAVSVLRAYQTFAEQQPDESHVVGAFQQAGAKEWVPAALVGAPALFLTAIHTDADRNWPDRVASFVQSTAPAAGSSRSMSYRELQSMADRSEPHGHRYFTKSRYLTRIADPAEELTEAALRSPAPWSSIDFEYLRGAIVRPPPGGSAFPNRDASYICTVSAHWADRHRDVENIEWARQAIERLEPWLDAGAYLNYTNREPGENAVWIYGTERHGHLAKVKKRYDPDNVFRGIQNIDRI